MTVLELRRLRQIGWDFWDPIGIRASDDRTSTDSAWRTSAADEYDHYLLQAADMLRGGVASTEAAGYLDAIASDWMALGPVTEASHAASLRTAEAIAAYLREPPAPAPT